MFTEVKQSRDRNMAAIIDKFLLQNEVLPEFRDVTEDNVVMWVKENTVIEVHVPIVPAQNRTDPKEFRCNSWMRW